MGRKKAHLTESKTAASVPLEGPPETTKKRGRSPKKTEKDKSPSSSPSKKTPTKKAKIESPSKPVTRSSTLATRSKTKSKELKKAASSTSKKATSSSSKKTASSTSKKTASSSPKKTASPSPKKTTKRSPSPKKVTAKKKTTVTRKTKPSYAKMIAAAIRDLGDLRSGSSRSAISNYIKSNYPIGQHFPRYLTQALKDGELDKYFTKKSPRSHSYRLTTKGRDDLLSKRIVKKKVKKPVRKDKTTGKKVIRSEKAETKKSEKKRERSTKKPEKSERSKSPTRAPKVKKAPRVSSSTSPLPYAGTQSSKKTHVWQYEDHGWHLYDGPASDIVEDAYQEYISNPGMMDVRAVHSGKWNYQVDFINNTQTNIDHTSHTQRNIKRIVNPEYIHAVAEP